MASWNGLEFGLGLASCSSKVFGPASRFWVAGNAFWFCATGGFAESGHLPICLQETRQEGSLISKKFWTGPFQQTLWSLKQGICSKGPAQYFLDNLFVCICLYAFRSCFWFWSCQSSWSFSRLRMSDVSAKKSPSDTLRCCFNVCDNLAEYFLMLLNWHEIFGSVLQTAQTWLNVQCKSFYDILLTLLNMRNGSKVCFMCEAGGYGTRS